MSAKLFKVSFAPVASEAVANIVPEDAVIDHLGEEGALRDEFAEHMRDVLLALWREGLLIAGSAAEGDDNGLMSLGKLLRDKRA